MKSLLIISWRSIWRHKRRTIISASAISFGLSLAVFFLSLGDGVYAQMIDDTVSMNGGHFTLQHPEYLDAPAIDLVVPHADALRKEMARLDGVKETKILVLGQGMGKSGRGDTGVAIMGVEPEVEVKTSPLAKRLIAGRFLEKADEDKIVVGQKMAERLKLEVGSKLVLSSTDVNGDLIEDLVRIKGIFKMGSAEVDGHMVEVPIGFARRFFGLQADAATQVAVVLSHPDRRDAVMAAAEKIIPRGVAALPWEKVLPDLANYIRLDRGSNQVFQGIIIFLCLFTIFNTILMSVLERTREFAVMMALGTPLARMRGQIFLESMLLALLGGAVGLAIGGGLGGYFQVFGLDMSALVGDEMDVSGFAVNTRVHAKVTLEMLVTMGGGVFGATLLISLFAMRRVKRIDVAEVLR